MFTFDCWGCGRPIKARAGQSGLKAKCPKCGREVTIPQYPPEGRQATPEAVSQIPEPQEPGPLHLPHEWIRAYDYSYGIGSLVLGTFTFLFSLAPSFITYSSLADKTFDRIFFFLGCLLFCCAGFWCGKKDRDLARLHGHGTGLGVAGQFVNGFFIAVFLLFTVMALIGSASSASAERQRIQDVLRDAGR